MQIAMQHNWLKAVYSILAFSLVIGFTACEDEGERSRPDIGGDQSEVPSSQNDNNTLQQPSDNNQLQQQQQQSQGQTQQQPNANTGNSSGETVHHYVCPNDCEGSGGATQGTCPECGEEYVHNSAYHQQQNQGGQQQQPQGQSQGQQNIEFNQSEGQPEFPPKNADGEFHYVCSAGCDAGAASAGTCPECGAELAHNPAYHN